MTQVTSAQANKILQAALFTEANRSHSLVNMLTDEPPKGVKVNGGKQTMAGAPVVRITDLTKQRGDSVDMQLFHQLSGRPTMGDNKIAGRLESMSFADFSLKISQTRHGVDAGGKMSQQRTKHDLIKTARTLLADGYYGRLVDQRGFAQLAGARGDFNAPDIILPMADDPEFADIMINPLTAPTYERHFFGGDATSFEAIDAADRFNLGCVDNMSLFLSEMANPIQPIRMVSDPSGGEPLYVLYVTPRQWHDFYTSTSGKDWQAMLAAAMERSKGWNHPIFRGEGAMWRGILVKPYKGMPIRFNQGSAVKVCAANSATGVEVDKVAGTTIDRAVLLGGQALANAFGSGEQGGAFSMHQEPSDHGNSTEISISFISGVQKIRFKQRNGHIQDHGCMVLDTAVSAVAR
ncbi:N4-gp56 family major capsid protein [Aeromonas veronii]|uniref:N4-gp56 family major capsid protein n=1 Tax=Aeromonas veronii TaxID=654 RepID=UPI001FD1F00D|nr:N4-gp56 family major capsid protein [Aeromonas veronii]MCJ7976769.1 N4-gp56 family major capsid protein [Aeromonas veronii]UOR20873.1 N4-gp56 family major capsid protein [Aeromonas veronii]